MEDGGGRDGVIDLLLLALALELLRVDARVARQRTWNIKSGIEIEQIEREHVQAGHPMHARDNDPAWITAYRVLDQLTKPKGQVCVKILAASRTT